MCPEFFAQVREPDSLRAAAFGDAAAPDGSPPSGDGSPRRRWLAAVLLGGQGRYAAAAALLHPLLADPDPVFASLAASTFAAHRRQLGAHAVARRLDALALRALAAPAFAPPPRRSDPDGVDRTGAHADALLGLAADAVGLHRPEQARRVLARLAELGPLGWRSRVRSGWVHAEASLAGGAPEHAVPVAERALAVAASWRAARHVTKSEIVLAAALLATDTQSVRDQADELLARAHRRSLEREYLPLAWPSALLLADVRPRQADHWREQASQLLSRLLNRTDPAGVRHAAESVWMANALVRNGERVTTDEAENFLTD